LGRVVTPTMAVTPGASLSMHFDSVPCCNDYLDSAYVLYTCDYLLPKSRP
jgi:hypothetical protein